MKEAIRELEKMADKIIEEDKELLKKLGEC